MPSRTQLAERTALVLVPGITIALWCVRALIAGDPAVHRPAGPTPELVDVPVAAARLEPGWIVRDEDIRWSQIARTQIPDEAVLFENDLVDEIVVTLVERGSLILKSQLAGPPMSGLPASAPSPGTMHEEERRHLRSVEQSVRQCIDISDMIDSRKCDWSSAPE